jgi:hypothetical protein
LAVTGALPIGEAYLPPGPAIGDTQPPSAMEAAAAIAGIFA